jgi:hypothetical protein
MSRQVIRLHPDAPPKPAAAAPRNGCGVCCAAESWPVGVLVSGRNASEGFPVRHAACHQ